MTAAAKGHRGSKTKGKAQVRIAQDLVDWLDEHAKTNKDGFTSRALVAEEAIRRYRDALRSQGAGWRIGRLHRLTP